MNCAHRRFRSRMVSLGIAGALLFASSGAIGANTYADSGFKVARLGREFEIRAGQRTTVKGTRLQIRFAAVENDSRCPSDVTCVWAGNAAVQLQLGSGKRSKTVTLNTSNSPSFVGEVEYQGYKVKLIGLSPYPRSDRKIAKRDYRATLLVSKQ